MKLPALAIAAAFASGIAFGPSNVVANRAASHSLLIAVLAVAAAFLLGTLLLIHVDRIALAGVTSIICWLALGVGGACIAQQPLPTEHIVNLARADTVNLKSPLRFHGTLRDEPEKLPWGLGYDVQLTGVEYKNALQPATAGLRLSFAGKPGGAEPVPLHTGDSITFITEAKPPQTYRDEGAFDRRAYLAQQGVYLVGALRSPELWEVIQPGARTISSRISRARQRLRAEIATRFPTTRR